MKYCQQCGTALLDAAVMCPNCGASVGNPQAPVQQQASTQSNPANLQTCTVSPAPQAKKEDRVSVGFCILAFFIPLFGIIYWVAVHRDTPKRGRVCGIIGIVSMVLKIMLIFFLIIIVAIFGDSTDENCETCWNSGYVQCETCHGLGEFNNGLDCPDCVHGSTECKDCDNAPDYHCRTCRDSGYVQCDSCDGWGESKKGSDCPYCVRGWAECETCDATRK